MLGLKQHLPCLCMHRSIFLEQVMENNSEIILMSPLCTVGGPDCQILHNKIKAYHYITHRYKESNMDRHIIPFL